MHLASLFLLHFLIFLPSVSQAAGNCSPKATAQQLARSRCSFTLPDFFSVYDTQASQFKTLKKGTQIQFESIGDTGDGGRYLELKVREDGVWKNYFTRVDDPKLNNWFPNCHTQKALNGQAEDLNAISEAIHTETEGNKYCGVMDLGCVTDQDYGKDGELQTLDPRHSPNPGGWDKRCYNFIQKDGSIGAWGEEFLKSAAGVDRKGYNGLETLMEPFLWKKICPGFPDFSQEKKKHMITYFIASKTMDEGNCNPSAYSNSSKMPNPPGVGFFMLEGKYNIRKKRGKYCAGPYRRGSTQRKLPKELQFQCAVSQIIDVQVRKNKPFGSPKGYWQEANRMNGDISKSILKGYEGCAK